METHPPLIQRSHACTTMTKSSSASTATRLQQHTKNTLSARMTRTRMMTSRILSTTHQTSICCTNNTNSCCNNNSRFNSSKSSSINNSNNSSNSNNNTNNNSNNSLHIMGSSTFPHRFQQTPRLTNTSNTSIHHLIHSPSLRLSQSQSQPLSFHLFPTRLPILPQPCTRPTCRPALAHRSTRLTPPTQPHMPRPALLRPLRSTPRAIDTAYRGPRTVSLPLPCTTLSRPTHCRPRSISLLVTPITAAAIQMDR